MTAPARTESARTESARTESARTGPAGTAPAGPRLGVAARAPVDRDTGRPPTDRPWRISTEWEMLELADGSVFFDSVYADHRLLTRVSGTLRRLLRRIDRGPVTFAELAAELSGPDGAVRAEQVARHLAPLVRAGILVLAPDESRPDWVDDALADRFSTEIEWFNGFAREQGGQWELFRRLREASVAVLGLGGAGSMLSLMLTAAGVGRLRLVDGDVVEQSNLVRQILYFPDQASDHGPGQRKAESLSATLRRFSPHTRIETVPEFVRTPQDAARLTDGVDFVAVCADAPRFLLNRWIDQACKRSGTPYLGAFVGSVGPMFVPGRSACFGCFENRFRRDIGERHDMVVDALAAKPSWRYPAFVSGPLAIAHLMTTEIVLYLTGAATPSTIGGILRMTHPYTVREDFPVDPDCDCAAAHRGATLAGWDR